MGALGFHEQSTRLVPKQLQKHSIIAVSALSSSPSILLAPFQM